MAEFKRLNASVGGYWFEPGTMRFFRSRVEGPMLAGGYFVSSEQFDDCAPRLYTIRRAFSDGSVETIGGFQAYASRRAAVMATPVRVGKGRARGAKP